MNKKSSPIKIIFFSFLSFVALILVAFIIMFYIFPLFEHGPRGSLKGTNNWMKNLDNEIPINHVVLPGSHDSGAINADLAYFAKCQSLNIKEQLEAGFRYLDIRLDITDDDKLCLMHGFIHCRQRNFPFSKYLYLEDVLNDCYSFLDNNPTECIIFVTKAEGDNTDINKLNSLLTNLISNNKKYWLETNTIPTIGELRGKILLLERYNGNGIYLNWQDQGNKDNVDKYIEKNENDLINLYVQDRYKYNSDDKWTAFKKGIVYIPNENDYIKISFLSTNGNKAYGHPYRYAKDLNKKLLNSEILLNGWVIVDFCSPKLAYRIYQENFK